MGGRYDMWIYECMTEEDFEEYDEMLDRYLFETEGYDNYHYYGRETPYIRITLPNGETVTNESSETDTKDNHTTRETD